MASKKELSPKTSPALSMTSYVAWSTDDKQGLTYEIPRSALQLLGVKAPPGALLTLFGFGGARDGLGAIFPVLSKQGLLCRPVVMTVPITYEAHVRIGIVEGDALLPTTNFLHLSRIRADLRALIRSLWIDVCRAHGLPNHEVETMFPAKPTTHPEWIGDLLQDPRLKHIHTIAFPVASSAGVIPLVAVFRPTKVTLQPVAGLPGKVKLPSTKH